MSKRRRKRTTRATAHRATDAISKKPTPVLWMVRIAFVIACVGVVAFGVYAMRRRTRVPSVLPPLSIVDVGGARTPVIDSEALMKFVNHYQLPKIPDLTEISAEAARDIHAALARVDSQPEEAAAFGHLGRVFQSHQYLAEALACYARARTLDPSAFEWAYYVGRLHADAFELPLAIEALKTAADLNSKYAPTFLALGNCYLQSGEADLARTAFQELLVIRPHSSHGYLGLAQVAFESQEYQIAVDLLTKALVKNPNDFRVHHLLGQSYQQLEQPSKAQYHLRSVKNLNQPDQLSKHVSFDDPLYHEMLACNTTDVALAQRQRAAMGTGQSELAIRLAQQLCDRHPNDAKRMHSLAESLKQGKRFKDALNRAEQAIRLEPGLLEAHLTKAQLLMIFRRNGEALKELDLIVAQAPNSFDGHYNRGAAQVLSNQYEAAVESFREAVRLKGDSARAHVALAEALGQVGRRSDAMDEYRHALELDPSNIRARQQLGEPSHQPPEISSPQN